MHHLSVIRVKKLAFSGKIPHLFGAKIFECLQGVEGPGVYCSKRKFFGNAGKNILAKKGFGINNLAWKVIKIKSGSAQNLVHIYSLQIIPFELSF